MRYAVWLQVPDPQLSDAIARRLVADGYRPQSGRDRADLALLDPTLGGEEDAPAPPCPALALIASDDPDEHVRLLRAGYRGIFDAREDLSQLGAAMQAIARGDTWADPEVAARAGDALHEPALHEHEALAGMPLTLGGHDERITRRLATAESTVRVFVSSTAGRARPWARAVDSERYRN